jgi:hypothetical protein
MKKLFTILIVLIFASACSSNLKPEAEKQEPSLHSIKPLASYATLIYLYEIDGHHYVAHYNGGILHAESCPCKVKP